MFESILSFILSNPNEVCIPLGLFIRYLGTILEFLNPKKKNLKNEDIMAKTYARLVELSERNEDEVQERTNVLIENAILKKELRKIKRELSEIKNKPH